MNLDTNTGTSLVNNVALRIQLLGTGQNMKIDMIWPFPDGTIAGVSADFTSVVPS